MPRALLFETLLERLHQLVPAAERLDERLFLVAQRSLDHFPDPLFRDLGANVEDALHSFEIAAEREIEAVVQRLVLDQARAREHVEIVDVVGDDALPERVEQRPNSRVDTGSFAAFRCRKKSISIAKSPALLLVRPFQLKPQVLPYRRPLAFDDAEHHRVAIAAVGGIWWLRSTASCFAPSLAIAAREASLNQCVRNSTAMHLSFSNA